MHMFNLRIPEIVSLILILLEVLMPCIYFDSKNSSHSISPVAWLPDDPVEWKSRIINESHGHITAIHLQTYYPDGWTVRQHKGILNLRSRFQVTVTLLD